MDIVKINAASMEINELHKNARSSAENAIQYATEAGRLLLQVKSALGHGQFTHWIRKNVRVSERQAQRYMAVASGKAHSTRQLFDKNDSVSLLTNSQVGPDSSAGIWQGDRWQPEPGFMYLIHEEATGNYFVQPASSGGTHVCRHYSGDRLSAIPFYWRYTILSELHDPESINEFYIGTRFAPILRTNIDTILASYGLRDLRGASSVGIKVNQGVSRPWKEPDPEHWYWDAPTPDDGLWAALVEGGVTSSKGIPTGRCGI